MLYRLSKLIPVRFTSRYRVTGDLENVHERSTWWQWRGRIFRHRRTTFLV